jgi:hypothetical protein
VPNPKGQFCIGSSLTPTHGQEHVQAITTLWSGKQMDNQMARPEEEEESKDKLAGDVGPDTVTPNVED